MKISQNAVATVIEAIQDQTPVRGATHSFYRYPARFSPVFAAAAIEAFTDPGDVVYDPFMGGGTTLVEAMRSGRQSIGTDVNELAVFVSRVKSRIYTERDLTVFMDWVIDAKNGLKLNQSIHRPESWITDGYQRNFSTRQTWPIRKSVELALLSLDNRMTTTQKDLIRCLLLKTTQWAIDCRKAQPTANQYRDQLAVHAEEMIEGARSIRREVLRFGNGYSSNLTPMPIQSEAQNAPKAIEHCLVKAPNLILTSPPYPGIHVLYHRWQVNGRKETPAPYWIADCKDGSGASFYTLGDRKEANLERYFDNMRQCYKALAQVSDHRTWLIQLIAFSAPEWQLPTVLAILQQAGFAEQSMHGISSSVDGRFWRSVPNRKFYAGKRGTTPSSREVLLLHRLG